MSIESPKKNLNSAGATQAKRRGRPRKEDANQSSKSTPKKADLKRTNKVNKTQSLDKYIKKSKKEQKIETESESESESIEQSDEDFKLDLDQESKQSESEVSEEEEGEDDKLSDTSIEIIKKPSSKRKYATRKSLETEPQIEIENFVDKFDSNEKILEWEYELDQETKCFKKPKLPQLSDEAIEQFKSPKSNPPKLIIYECPYCKKIFTYTLVFKSHLFSCPDNKNVPEYFLFCSKYDTCKFKSKKKQDILNHFTKQHSNLKTIIKNESLSESDSEPDQLQLSTSKKNQLKVTNYFYIDKSVFKFVYSYLNQYLASKIRNLSKIDQFFDNIKYNEFKVNFKLGTNLKFQFKDNKIDLASFEGYLNIENKFFLFNLNEQITAIDWCPFNDNKTQYLAVSTLPNEYLLNQLGLNKLNKSKTILDLVNTPNLIYILKLENLNSLSSFSFSLNYAILNRQIGIINCLKFRPFQDKTDSLGYLLSTGSDGNSYIYKIDNKSNLEQVVYEPSKLVVLKTRFSNGQCTSGDWSQLNGAVQIAIGYANGTVCVYYLNSSNIPEFDQNQEELILYPIKSINCHLTFVKSVKWSKLNSSLLCTGSLFSRELKVWDLSRDDKALFDYEVFLTDFEFSLNSNDLLISKEMNLKGENHMLALDLGFSLFNTDKDESRAHSSLFYTFSSMNSIDQSDYLNKFLVCDNDGSIFLSQSDGSKYWVQKNKLMSYSYSRIAKLSFKSELENKKENYLNLEAICKLKENTRILIDLEHSNIKPSSKLTNSTINSINVNLNSLTKIKWNKNIGYLNWYAASSLSGFLFLNCINELNIDFFS